MSPYGDRARSCACIFVSQCSLYNRFGAKRTGCGAGNVAPEPSRQGSTRARKALLLLLSW